MTTTETLSDDRYVENRRALADGRDLLAEVVSLREALAAREAPPFPRASGATTKADDFGSVWVRFDRDEWETFQAALAGAVVEGAAE